MECDAHVFSLGALVESVATVRSIRAQGKGIGFFVDLPPGAPVDYVGDRLRIRQILFLTKPFNKDVLRDCVQRQLQRPLAAT
jgi:hypothetical protein